MKWDVSYMLYHAQDLVVVFEDRASRPVIGENRQLVTNEPVEFEK